MDTRHPLQQKVLEQLDINRKKKRRKEEGRGRR
jgi:hypothetical protein